MSGIENILAHIREDATSKSQELLAQGQKDAQEILANAKAEGEARRDAIRTQMSKDSQLFEARIQAAIQLKEKQILLKSKQAMIQEMIHKSWTHLTQLPADTYFSTLLEKIPEYALGMEGTILFSPGDRSRLPEGYESKIQERLALIPGAVLKVGQETRNMTGGFILIYPDIEINCSLESLFESKKDHIQDKLRELLFG